MKFDTSLLKTLGKLLDNLKKLVGYLRDAFWGICVSSGDPCVIAIYLEPL